MDVVLSLLIFSSVILSSSGDTATGDEVLPAQCTRTCVPSKPICGSDGNTYPSECHLKKRNCVKKDLVKQCNGPCRKVKGHSCCSIKKRCPKSFRTSGPACGTNDVTYPNLCLLAIAVCKEKGLKVKGEKKCSDIVPTESPAKPTEGEYCVDKQFGKQCRGECKTVNDVHCCDIRTRCPQVFKTSGPVCGTDGVSYVNQCVLAKKTCRTAGLLIQKDYDGACREKVVTTSVSKVATTEERTSENSVTDSQNCYDAALGKKCTGQCKFVSGVHCCDIIDYGCPKSFTLSGPVCGSDGSSYSNLCVLARRSCQTSGSKLVKVSYGTCDKTSPIIEDESRPNTNVFCVDKKHGKSCDGECKVVNNHHCCDIRNRCPNKLKKTGSVCGTDGRTYGNQCALARKSCREHGSILRMAHKGSCQKNKPPRPTRPSKLIPAFDKRGNDLPGEGDMTMPPFLITDLLIQRDHVDEDPCRADCPSWDSPVCGSNMVTYKNTCELKKVQCKKPSIRQFCDARCRLDDGRNCCMMIKKCHKSLKNTGIVCGSDGKNYASECHLFREACRTVEFNLQKDSDGPCPPDQTQTVKMKFSMIECLATFHCPIDLALAGEVCSDIGTTYQDECALKFDSCWGENRNIGLDYVGRCKP